LLIGFTPNHPVVKALDLQIAAITAEIGRADAHIRQLPMLERDLLRLNRDLKVNSDLYATLLNSAQQLRLVKAGKVSNVRLIDPPMMPQRPARPNRGKIVGIATAAGLALGLGVALLRRLLNQGIESAATIERMLGARVVYANIPHSRTQEEVDRGGVQPAGQLPLLACVEPGDPAIESLRSFRTLLHSAMAHCRNNIILISGPTKGLGKSFVSANLAAVLAMSGKRVLLLDADLRDGALHRVFGQPPAPGLSEAIAGIQPLDRALHHAPISGLDFLACGNLPPNPSEFLLHPNFRILLQTLAQQYDYVLIDSSPLLEVSDTLVIAADAGAAFVLARAQVTTTDDINESIKRLNLAGCAPQGILFNDLKLRTQPFQGRFLPRLRQLGHTG
jgi:tyrosine-protein kinase Etk/Wzc